MRILIIEDSERLQRSITMGLRKEGFKVDVSGDGNEGYLLARSFDYDVIILDLMLPGMDGITLLTKLRQVKNPVNVLILSAKDTVEDRVTGLQTGADDYLIKPFAFEELLARVQALISRHYGVKQNVIEVADLTLDISRRIVRRGEDLIDLPPREYALFELLVLERGKLISRTKIEEHIYDERVEPMSNVVDAAICSLRKKIDIPGNKSVIQTRRGMGYIIDKDDGQP
ncbi:response regulator [candidate division CSSED10-310 bacterium]|uniref:Response regulator n=1 Tax=candidate division CSSED10-310 bacterium TaxID=2855610 RepID=A0ABV6YX06_UNCC1